MKRRDWKIKKSKKIIYDKYLIKFKSKKLFRRSSRFIRFFTISLVLRKLFLRKNKTLRRRDYITNFFFLKNLIVNLRKKKRNYFYNLFLNKQYNYLYDFKNNMYLPAFLFKKKLSNYFNKFKKTQDQFQYDYLFYNSLKNENYNFKNSEKKDKYEGVRIYLFNINEEKNFQQFISEEDNSDIFFKKENNQEIMYNLNLHFNFNIFQNNILEIYKILIYLYIFNLYNK